MVYIKLLIINGCVVTQEDVKKYLSNYIDDVSQIDDFDVYDQFSKIYKENTVHYDRRKLFYFPCCSESGNNKFIFGEVVHIYYRKYVRCEKCPEYAVCDYCIGVTNNGHYDIDSIFNKPVQVELSHLCSTCFHDNKKPLDKGDICECCNSKLNIVIKDNKLKCKVFKDTFSKLSYYYMIDDCLSCS